MCEYCCFRRVSSVAGSAAVVAERGKSAKRVWSKSGSESVRGREKEVESERERETERESEGERKRENEREQARARAWTSGLVRFRVSQCATGERRP